MPFSHTISERDKTAYVRATGPIDLRDGILAIHALVDNREFQSHFKVIADLREATFQPSTMDLFAIRDVLLSFRNRFLGGITLLVAEKELYIARLTCDIVNSADFRMEAVTKPLS